MIGTKPRQLRDSETLGLVLSARMESARARTAAAVFLMLGAEFVSVGLWPVIWFASVVLSLVADRAIAQACQRRRDGLSGAMFTALSVWVLVCSAT